MKIVIWGTGNVATRLIEEIKEISVVDMDTIIAFCDNDSSRHGKKFEEIPVISPSELKELEIDLLVVATLHKNAIVNQILKDQIVPIEKIVDYVTYRRVIYTREQYYKRYGGQNAIEIDNSCRSLVVYTVITGDYDILRDPVFVSQDIDYICLTNNKNIKSSKWDVRYVEDENLTNVMLSRRIKIMPWEYIDCNNPVIWVDANIMIKKDIRTFVKKYKKKKSMLCFPHSERECICDETSAIIPYCKDLKSEVIKQTATYLDEGIPINFGLYETGCMYRDLNDSIVKELMKQWWNEIVKYTYRDQISLPYICWKNNYSPDICDCSIFYNEWLEYNGHKAQGRVKYS